MDHMDPEHLSEILGNLRRRIYENKRDIAALKAVIAAAPVESPRFFLCPACGEKTTID